eukprot:CCRYP_010310-RA/>CCRYP_010310-RA protein AED:0.42 eAED:0.42 QI:0/0/0/1/0/0/4/0/203
MLVAEILFNSVILRCFVQNIFESNYPIFLMKSFVNTNSMTRSTRMLLPDKVVDHTNHPIQFIITVDDFGVQYVGKENAKHFNHQVDRQSVHWHSSVLGSCQTPGAFAHARLPAECPHHFPPHSSSHSDNNYGTKHQYAKAPSASPQLNKKGGKLSSKSVGSFYFMSALSIALALSSCLSVQSPPNLLRLRKRRLLKHDNSWTT